MTPAPPPAKASAGGGAATQVPGEESTFRKGAEQVLISVVATCDPLGVLTGGWRSWSPPSPHPFSGQTRARSYARLGRRPERASWHLTIYRRLNECSMPDRAGPLDGKGRESLAGYVTIDAPGRSGAGRVRYLAPAGWLRLSGVHRWDRNGIAAGSGQCRSGQVGGRPIEEPGSDDCHVQRQMLGWVGGVVPGECLDSSEPIGHCAD